MIARIVPALSSVLVLTLVLLAFFSFFGLVLFHKAEPHYFGTFARAAWQLWVLMTTSNFPDVRFNALCFACCCACLRWCHLACMRWSVSSILFGVLRSWV